MEFEVNSKKPLRLTMKRRTDEGANPLEIAEAELMDVRCITFKVPAQAHDLEGLQIVEAGFTDGEPRGLNLVVDYVDQCCGCGDDLHDESAVACIQCGRHVCTDCVHEPYEDDSYFLCPVCFATYIPDQCPKSYDSGNVHCSRCGLDVKPTKNRVGCPYRITPGSVADKLTTWILQRIKQLDAPQNVDHPPAIHARAAFQEFLERINALRITEALGTKITAAELRAMGCPLPDSIPDVAWIPRHAMHVEWELDANAGRVESGMVKGQWRVTFTAPFQWVEAKSVVDEG